MQILLLERAYERERKMKNMKKLLLLVMCIGVIGSATACGNDKKTTDGADQDRTTQEATDNNGDGVIDNAVRDVTDGIDDVTDDVTDGINNMTDDLTGNQKDTAGNGESLTDRNTDAAGTTTDYANE